MCADPQDRVSEITEITEWSRLYHFFASLGWSVLVGTAGIMLVLLISARSSLDAGAILGGLVWVAIFVAAFSLAGMVLIGLPLTFLLLLPLLPQHLALALEVRLPLEQCLFALA